MDKKVGDYYRELRSYLKMTLEDFSYNVGLSKSYINQIEKNERIPSKNKLFQMLCYFNEFQKLEPQLPTDDILHSFSNQKKLDESRLKKDYEKYVKEFKENLKQHEANIGAQIRNIDTNKIAYPTDHNKKIEELDKPYFDLEWLLTQKEFHVFYGNKFYTDKNKIHTDSVDELTYNKLNDDDKKMIKNIIENIFETKYDQYIKPDGFKKKK
ncbi:helix-turn-helix domain-containing protein [Staphylococcus ureilyticus]|uniref:helix-turn-helix domain-containing protein n=1 Tax=Staphylococcus ureilyticus TaxID=94138 RepID=UPI0039C3F4DE